MSGSRLLDRLIRALQIQPGVGPRSAGRIAYALLGRKRDECMALGELLTRAATEIRECARCRNFSDDALCAICADDRRQSGALCVVESPADVDAIERSGDYRGLYFVLHGHLSPMDGIGLKELGADQLDALLAGGGFSEVIIATNPTVEGDATASLVAKIAERHGIEKVTRPSFGVPVGGALDNADQRTLARSFKGRRAFDLGD